MTTDSITSLLAELAGQKSRSVLDNQEFETKLVNVCFNAKPNLSPDDCSCWAS